MDKKVQEIIENAGDVRQLAKDFYLGNLSNGLTDAECEQIARYIDADPVVGQAIRNAIQEMV